MDIFYLSADEFCQWGIRRLLSQLFTVDSFKQRLGQVRFQHLAVSVHQSEIPNLVAPVSVADFHLPEDIHQIVNPLGCGIFIGKGNHAKLPAIQGLSCAAYKFAGRAKAAQHVFPVVVR